MSLPRGLGLVAVALASVILIACAAKTDARMPSNASAGTSTPAASTTGVVEGGGGEAQGLDGRSPSGDDSSGVSTSQGGGGSTSARSAGSASLDVESLDAELAAMERELDGMKMPSDSDFDSAAGSVY